MAAKAENYNQEIIQVMKEHNMLEPEEEEQITTYLLVTQWE